MPLQGEEAPTNAPGNMSEDVQAAKAGARPQVPQLCIKQTLGQVSSELVFHFRVTFAQNLGIPSRRQVDFAEKHFLPGELRELSHQGANGPVMQSQICESPSNPQRMDWDSEDHFSGDHLHLHLVS